MTEAVLHWHQANFVRVIEVDGAPSRFIIPMPWLESVSMPEGEEPFIFADNETGWVFVLRDQDEREVLHYYAEEPPWATQIRSAMSWIQQCIEHAALNGAPR